MEIENDNLRAAVNAAQQRAEQAERERDEARAVIDRAIEILGLPVPDGAVTKDQMANEHLNVNALLTTFRKSYYAAPQAQPAWTPLTGAEIAASLEGKPPILPADFDIDRAPTVKADDARQHKFIEIPGHVHWLFLNWPKVEPDGEFLEACLRNYNLWIDDGYTDVKHFPMGDGKLLIEFRKPEVSA